MAPNPSSAWSAAHPGTYYGTDVYEGTHAAGQVISMTAPPGLDADQISLYYVTHRETYTVSNSVDANYTGYYRDPLPLSDGQLLASHTWTVGSDANIGTANSPLSRYSFRLTTLAPAGNGYWTAAQTMTLGSSKTVSYYITNTPVSYSGLLWEMMPVEVAARARPARITPQLPDIEVQVISNAAVNLAQHQAYLVQNNLALAISRYVTTRDDNDQQQPYRLQVGISGAETITGSGKLYNISFMQLFQADQMRGMGGALNPLPGRRFLAQPLHDRAAMAANIPSAAGPAGSMVLANDGSMAAFVPARRALTWQLTDANGLPVVRERMWVSFQPGEIRVCTSCHGLNDKDQAGNTAPTNPPQALDTLMQYWKAQLTPQKLYLPLVVK
jgi:Hydrazine synthase alpha subunit middle domain